MSSRQPYPWALPGREADGRTIEEAPCGPVRGAGSGCAAQVEGLGLQTTAAECRGRKGAERVASSSKQRVMQSPTSTQELKRGFGPAGGAERWPLVPGRGWHGG